MAHLLDLLVVGSSIAVPKGWHSVDNSIAVPKDFLVMGSQTASSQTGQLAREFQLMSAARVSAQQQACCRTVRHRVSPLQCTDNSFDCSQAQCLTAPGPGLLSSPTRGRH